MHFYTLGKASQPALILLHGWGLDGERYRELAKQLSHNWRVIVPDLPGFGKSPEPKNPWTLNDYVKAVRKLLRDEQVDSAIFIGHSFGGRISLRLAHKYPKMVKKLILTGTPGIEKWQWKRSSKRLIAWLAAKALKYLTWIPPVKKLRDRFYRHRDLGKLQGVMAKTFRHIIRDKLKKDARALQQSTLLLWGARDQMTPVEDAEAMLTIIPHSYLKIFTQVGHKLPYEKASEFAQEVERFCL